jgi:hypothetical protein
MYASIRSYSLKANASRANLEKLAQQVEHDFVGKIERLPGFHGYHMCSAEGRLLTISLFESKASATESARIAAEFVKNTKLPLALGAVEVTEGELLISREAHREVGAH